MVGCVGARAGGSTPKVAVGAWQVNSQQESVRMAHWPVGQLGGWHIMRHIWGRESSQNDVGAASVTTAGLGFATAAAGCAVE